MELEQSKGQKALMPRDWDEYFKGVSKNRGPVVGLFLDGEENHMHE